MMMKNIQVTKNFKLWEAFRSRTARTLGIDNTTRDPKILVSICHTFFCAQIIRNEANKRFKVRVKRELWVKVNSLFRNNRVNKKAGGHPKSWHRLGQAIDMEIPGVSNRELFELIKDLHDSGVIRVDKCLIENHDPKIPDSGWIHLVVHPIRSRGIFKSIWV